MSNITPEQPEARISEPIYPSLHLKLKDIPESKNWKIGGKYTLLVGVKHSAIREDQHGGQVTLDVIKVKPFNKKGE